MERQHWTFDRKINIGHIITTLTVAASVMIWALSVEKRVSTNEIRYQELKNNIEQSQSIIDKRLDRIENKLDRLIENKR